MTPNQFIHLTNDCVLFSTETGQYRGTATVDRELGHADHRVSYILEFVFFSSNAKLFLEQRCSCSISITRRIKKSN